MSEEKQRFSTRNAPIEERLWSRIKKTETGCWEYQGSRADGRYGSIAYLGRNQRAHRVAYQIAKGPIPDGNVVMHSCDNPPCVNPDHLSVGTLSDNVRDCRDKGRLAYPKNWAGWSRNKTHCKRGHEFTEENTRIRPTGARACKECVRQESATRRAAAARADR